MRILIDIGHPGHVHLFRNTYFELIRKEHQVFVTVRDIPVAKRLLDFYNIPYFNIGRKKDSLFGKAAALFKQDQIVLRYVKKNKIELGLSSGIVLSHVSRFSKMRSIMFDDDDDTAEPLIVRFGHPWAGAVLSPSCIARKTKKLVSYDGTHELAYLHPEYFTPDEAIVKELGLTGTDKYFLLRFVAFKGHHDYGNTGIALAQKKNIIELLKPYGKIFITAEREIEPELEQYRLPVSPEKIHSLMYYASLVIGDSQTMTSEAAILGVPALKCNTFAGKLSVPNELESKYGLCYSYQPEDFEKFIDHIKQLLSATDLKPEWQKKRAEFLKDKIDVTAFMVWFIENYPESYRIMKESPEYQKRFK